MVPAFIKERVLKTKPKNPSGIEKAFIKDEIEKKQDLLIATKEEYCMRLPQVCRKLSFLDKIRFCKLLSLTTERLRQQVETKNTKTMKWLVQSQLGQGVLRHSHIVNLAGIDLTDIQKDVLCRGLDFGIPPRVDKLEVFAEFELCWRQLEDLPTSEDKHAECKTTLASLAHKFANTKVDRTGFPLRNEHLKVIGDLRKNSDIVVTRPDKGKGVVLLNRGDYVEKMQSILSQQDKFQKIGDVETNDNTTQHERALQAFLLRACNNNHITREVYERCRPVGATRPRLYGVPKTHKSGVPLRPILSMVNAPQHELAKWLAEVLKPVVRKYSDHVIKDTFDFCDAIDESLVDHDAKELFMCSFDVTSLFTNIPITETIDICLDALYRDDSIPKPSMPEPLTRKMLLKATTEVEFSFDNQMYKQVDGVAMGSPLGPVLANIFVGFCESRLKERCEHWPLMYKRFVDDTFSVFVKRERALNFFRELNDIHPALKFTMEEESEGKLPFMDVLVERCDGKLVRSVYRKPTFTGQYVRWDSFAPTDQKISVLKSLVSRAKKICSSSRLDDELKKLKDIFLDNGFPGTVIDRIIVQATRQAPTAGRPPTQDAAVRLAFMRLPWIGPNSTGFRKEIKQTVVKAFPMVELKIAFTTNKAFSGRAKDVLPASSQSNVVYEFTCCCARTYVGKTSQCLAERAKQHLPAKLFDSSKPQRKTSSESAITRHVRESDECRDVSLLSRFKVLAKARHQQHLDVLEALYIKIKLPNSCVQKESSQVLKLV